MILYSESIPRDRFFLLKYHRDKTGLERFAGKITDYQNRLIDRIILDDYPYDSEQSKKNIYKTLFNLNLIPVTQFFNQITHNNVLSTDELIDYKNKSLKVAEKITGKQEELFLTNFNNLRELINTHIVDKSDYRKILKETPEIKRLDLLNLACENGINQDLLSQTWSIRDPDLLSRNLYRESQMETDYESALINPNITRKEWVWSQAENTRHSNMDGDTVELEEKFEVVNEVSGEVDYMLHPHDPEGSPANVYNCLCDMLYY